MGVMVATAGPVLPRRKMPGKSHDARIPAPERRRRDGTEITTNASASPATRQIDMAAASIAMRFGSDQ